MERLTPQDAAFLHLEDDVSAQHNVTVAIFANPEPPFDELVERVRQRVPLIPRCRQRVVPVPFGLERPVWVDDPNFILEYHVRHTGLPAGGSEATLANLMGRVLSQRLDRGKPLWELWVVSGLDEGRWAVVSKVHHAAIDGVSGTDVLSVLLDETVRKRRRVADHWTPEPLPSNARLGLEAVLDLTFNPLERYRATRRVFTVPRRMVGEARAGLRGDRMAGLKGPVGPHRVWRPVRIPLEPLAAVKESSGATTSDLALALITSGYRSLLAGRDELHALPPAIRTLLPLTAAPRPGGNDTEITAERADLPVGLDDPHARLDRIMEQTAVVLEREVFDDVHGFVAPTLLALGTRVATRTGANAGPIDTVTLSAPGPNVELTLLGSPMTEAFPVPPLAARVRICTAVFVYPDHLAFGITGDYDAARDLDVLCEGIRAGVAELVG